MTFFKSISKLLSGAKAEPAVHLAAFGKHPGWNDHADDMGLDTEALVNAKRMLYVQGVSQNIDSGAWERSEAGVELIGGGVEILDNFRHDFLWHMPPAALLAGRFWSSVDGKGRAKYPMVLCAQLADMGPGAQTFAAKTVLPFLTMLHQKCVVTTSANIVRDTVDADRQALRALVGDLPAAAPLTARELLAVARHPSLDSAKPAEGTGGEGAANGGANGGVGFLRIAYQFVGTLSAFRSPAKSGASRRSEQLRLPAAGLSPQEALLFWFRLAQSFLDVSAPLLVAAPDQPDAPWVDLIAGDPTPQNLFCLKAGKKSLPLTSDIPYTLDPSFIRAVEAHLAHCAGMPEGAPMPPWPF